MTPLRLPVAARIALLAVLALTGAARAEDEPARPKPKEGLTCRHWGVLLPEDAGQHRVYDGVRKGLELAQLERVCLKDVADDEASFTSFVAWHKTLPEPAPLVFAIGRRAGARLHAAGYAGPGVLVSPEVTVSGALLAPEPSLGARTARVRAEVPAEVWGAAVRDLLAPLDTGFLPILRFAWKDAGEKARDAALQFALAARATLDQPGPEGERQPDGTAVEAEVPDVLLHVRLGLGETLLSFDEALAQAQALGVPLLSDDPARFGSGATLLVVPDYQRLGRTAAEAGRRLWRNEPGALEPLVVKSTEVWVDLVAAEAIGLEPPLTFLASADRVRAPSKRPASEPGGSR